MHQKTTLIKNATLVNEGKIYTADIFIKGNFIEKIDTNGISMHAENIVDAENLMLLPGIIDNHVHFREPGLTHKADIFTESRAAIAGGVTSFMEMPNTSPAAVTHKILEEKYSLASKSSMANYSFYLGASSHNLEELKKTDSSNVCGIKVFMGSSTGDMAINDHNILEQIFKEAGVLIATHCEDDELIKKNTEQLKQKYGNNLPSNIHCLIRDEEACYKSTKLAVELATKHNTRLHILHVSTAKELDLFRNDIPLMEKKITAEACVHHLWFSDKDYDLKRNLIKWNPSIKSENDRNNLIKALENNLIDVIGTDHAPHLLSEKMQNYFAAPSGAPIIQFGLNIMIELFKKGEISLEKIVEKMCHHPAMMFEIDRRGFIREGFYADLLLLDLNNGFELDKSKIHSKCAWSPLEGTKFSSNITHTFVNGNLVYHNNKFTEIQSGMRLKFNR